MISIHEPDSTADGRYRVIRVDGRRVRTRGLKPNKVTNLAFMDPTFMADKLNFVLPDNIFFPAKRPEVGTNPGGIDTNINANYRRLLGDLEWDYSAPFEDVVGHYFPCPVCALRTLKAEVGCGMEKSKVENAKSLDDQWLVNGRFGVVQFSQGAMN